MFLEDVRRFYANEVAFCGHVESPEIREAFATVPRERFLGPGPWRIVEFAQKPIYWTTPDANPIHVYHNVLIAIDEARGLNNGQPSFHAKIMEHAELHEGEHAVHIGCGVGYYTALWATLVGPTGKMTALEVDPELAKKSEDNLKNLPHVEVRCESGSTVEIPEADVVFVNAGVSLLQPQWYQCLRPNGRLLVPFVTKTKGGQLFRIRRMSETTFSVNSLTPTAIYWCEGSFDDESERALSATVEKHGWDFTGVLRTDEHKESKNCWLHTKDYCLSFEG
jgi:protein-L-isoaspartate(D-aspartate) O-methyltransferase